MSVETWLLLISELPQPERDAVCKAIVEDRRRYVAAMCVLRTKLEGSNDAS